MRSYRDQVAIISGLFKSNLGGLVLKNAGFHLQLVVKRSHWVVAVRVRLRRVESPQSKVVLRSDAISDSATGAYIDKGHLRRLEEIEPVTKQELESGTLKLKSIEEKTLEASLEGKRHRDLKEALWNSDAYSYLLCPPRVLFSFVLGVHVCPVWSSPSCFSGSWTWTSFVPTASSFLILSMHNAECRSEMQ